MNPSRHPLILLLSLSILLASTFTYAGNVIVRNGQLNVSGGLYSDSDTLYIDSGNDKVGIGTTEPQVKIHAMVSSAGTYPAIGSNTAAIFESGSNTRVSIMSTNTAGGSLNFADNDDQLAGSIYYNHVNNYMIFATNGNIEQVRIDSSGNVGIGTATPSSKLDVAGNVTLGTASAHNYLEGNALWNGGNFSIKPLSDVTTMGIDFIGSSGDDEQGNTIFKGGGWSGDTSRQWIFRDAYNDGGSPADRLVINVLTGYVGIGTTGPRGRLDLGGTTGRKFFVYNDPVYPENSSIVAGMGIDLTGGPYETDLFFTTDAASPSTGRFYIGAWNGTEFIPKTTVLYNGNVGIGTTSPDGKLTVDANSWNTSINTLDLRNSASAPTSNGSFHVKFGRAFSDRYFDTVFNTTNYGIMGSETKLMVNWAESGANLLTIRSDGNIGIGTDSPGAILDVADRVYIGDGGEDLRIRGNFNGSVSTHAYITFWNNVSRSGYVGYGSSLNNELLVMNEKEDDLKLGTNSSTRLTVSETGNVGIGTTSPGVKLDVAGYIRSSFTDSSDAGAFHLHDSANNRIWQITNRVSDSNNFEWWYYNGSDWSNSVNIKTNGYVGIGTTAPERTLHIKNNLPYIVWEESDSDNTKWQMGGYTGMLSIWEFPSTPRMVIQNETGNVGIGTTAPESRLQVTGGGLCVGSDTNCNSDNNDEGVIYSSSTAMTQYDVAENYPTRENLSAGDVLVLDPQNPVFVKKSTQAYDPLVMGVVSESPGVILGGFNGQQYANETQVAVALTGRVPVKASNVNGDITVGDLLTPSDIPGTAMKYDGNCGLGTVVGKALEPCESDSCEILVLVALG